MLGIYDPKAQVVKSVDEEITLRKECLEAYLPMPEKSRDAHGDLLAMAFRRGLIMGMEYDGDNREVPTIEEIHEAATRVIVQERRDAKVRKRALAFVQKCDNSLFPGEGNFAYPKVTDCPVDMPRYCYLGGLRFLDETDMTLEDALRSCLEDDFVDFFRENSDPKLLERLQCKRRKRSRKLS